MDKFRLTYYDLPKYYLKKSWVEQKGIEAGIKLIAILLLIIAPLILWKIRKRAKRVGAVMWLSSHFTYPV